MNILMLVLLSLGAARATYLVTDDSLPFGYLKGWIARGPARKPVGKWTNFDAFRWWIKEGADCTHCVSVHAGFWAAVLATYAGWIPVNDWGDWPTFAVTWWAISGAVVLLELVHFVLLRLGEDD